MIDFYSELYSAYSLFNERYFDNKLPSVIITLERNYRIKGYFSPNRFSQRDETSDEKRHEIAMNPEYFGLHTVEETLATLIHEMTHLFFYGNDKSSVKGYHSKKWAAKMEEIGLIPTNTGCIGGKKTGYVITQVIKENGSFDRFVKKMIENGFTISWKDSFFSTEKTVKEKKKKRYKYKCSCGHSIWAKKGLNILCCDCKESYLIEEDKSQLK